MIQLQLRLAIMFKSRFTDRAHLHSDTSSPAENIMMAGRTIDTSQVTPAFRSLLNWLQPHRFPQYDRK
jgi:hypothetical protein